MQSFSTRPFSYRLSTLYQADAEDTSDIYGAWTSLESYKKTVFNSDVLCSL